MMDTEGSEVHTSELDQPMKAEVGLPRGLPRYRPSATPKQWADCMRSTNVLVLHTTELINS